MKLLGILSIISVATSLRLEPNYTSSAGVEIFNPSVMFPPTGPWSLMSKAGSTVYVAAGMRGIYPSNNTLAPVGIDRIRQAYANMIQLAELAGTDRPLCNQAQTELWGNDPNRQPPRSIIEVQRLNDDDIVEVEGTFLVA
ncbi:endoribonuclease l-psp [Colletotrichum scovillei]|uniref:endoribonuclease l-psp n=1 Tax=Colletotrichum scovillei TaxID=1209932 RepID=UPI0015C35EDE|nr:endoribonuclease l-psp [Colletotrichum scovillei]KAF4785853.1 endoribonuclease l-psp [Colletotrichum scovillei]